MKIGNHQFDTPIILAPMAGVTDRPFRILCRNLGADLCVSEMVTSQKRLWNTKKTQLRLNHEGEPGPRSVQIAGTEPMQMAEAAKFNADQGAHIIDINMGCPAKKVCNVLAGSALMKNESLVAAILESVVSAVDIPVTLKMRTGWDMDNRNALRIAKIAENAGIQALTIHGRTRHCAYKGDAEYDTIAKVKANTFLPVIANGDISSPEKAKQVLDYTGADALMVGRAAQGNPWIFREIKHFLSTGKLLSAPKKLEVSTQLLEHLENLYQFYGEISGVLIARKHIAWYCKSQILSKDKVAVFRKTINKIEDAAQQHQLVANFFNTSPIQANKQTDKKQAA